MIENKTNINRTIHIYKVGNKIESRNYRCMQTEDYCPGTTDFKFIKEKKGPLRVIEEDIEIIGFVNCGGCPGKKAILRARELVKKRG